MVSTLYIFVHICFLIIPSSMKVNNPNTLNVKKCIDFPLTGTGENLQWEQATWNAMSLMDETNDEYETKFKILYSEKGIYVLGNCEDKRISTSYTKDQDDIWNGDVFEVFLQTDKSKPLYFEYEVNPLDAELVILVPNNEGEFYGWSPWHYEGDRKVKKAIKIHGGKAKSGASISGWTVELFFPFALFSGLKNVPAVSGTEWRGNFYRMDYDTGNQIKWGWKSIKKSFHEYEKFGTIIFE